MCCRRQAHTGPASAMASLQSINHPPRGDRPELFDAVGADADVPVVEVDGGVAVAGDEAVGGARMPRRPCSSEARS